MRSVLLCLLLGWLPGCLIAQNFNIAFRSKMTFTGQNLANIWGYTAGGQEYALVGAQEGLIIVNITDPDNPQQLLQIPGPNSFWREIKTYSHYAYVVSEGGGAIQIVDLNNLPGTNLAYHSVDGGAGLTKGHALHIDEVKGYLYIYGSNLNAGRPQVYNLNTDPYNPSYVGHVSFTGYVHDGFVENDLLYAAHIYAGKFNVVNMANKTSPVLLGSQNTPGAFTHNTWKSGNTLFTTDEVTNSYLTAYNVADPSNITELDRIQITPASGSIVHNTHILNDYAVTSWYKDGFAIIDGSRPGNLVQVGRYDTYPGGSGNGFEGCWGVYPYFPSGNIVSSNIRALGTNNGELWVFTPTYVRGCFFEGTVTHSLTGAPLNGVKVEILVSGTADNTNALGQYKIGQAQGGSFTAKFSKIGFITQEHPVSLTNGVVVNLDVALQPIVLPVELVRFEVEQENNDAILSWETASETSNAGFEIQHSDTDGATWSRVGFVAARGDGVSPAFYTYRMPGLAPGTHYFRLRQTDLDGKYSFSPWRNLVLYGSEWRFDLWPNPAANHCMVRLRSPFPTVATLLLLSANLQPVCAPMQVEVDGETIFPLAIGDLPAGVYLVLAGGIGWEERILLLKR